jgi:hypothetical protein
VIENGICTATSTHARMDRPAHAIIGCLRHTLQRCSASSYEASQLLCFVRGCGRRAHPPRARRARLWSRAAAPRRTPCPPPPPRALGTGDARSVARITRRTLRPAKVAHPLQPESLWPAVRSMTPSGKIKTNTFRTIESSAHFSCLWQRRSCSRPIREKEQGEGAAPLRIQQQQLFGEIQRR